MAVHRELSKGARVGNYLLSELIGRGAFGEVWKATHIESPQRIRALKVTTNPAFRRQLAHEGGLPEIQHPNVVPILDSDTRLAEIPYVVMPYIAGGNLADLLLAHPDGLPEPRVAALLHDILAGLGAAHERGLIHRDIKPQNILLAADGRGLISDFGLSCSKVLPDAARSVLQSASLALEQGGTLAGTLAYMAPEVLNGDEPTPAADIYSVGVLLFELLVGRRPAGVESPGQARPGLRPAATWNRLYTGACGPLSARFADAQAMLAELLREEARWSAPGQGEADALAAPDTPRASAAEIATTKRPPASSVAVRQQLRSAWRVALADGRISKVEGQELKQLAESLGATPAELTEVVAELEGEARLRERASISDEQIIEILNSFRPDEQIFVKPGIPWEIMQTVRNYCGILPSETVLGVVDCTVMRSAKDCVVFTDRGVYYHNTGWKSGCPGGVRGFVSFEDLRHNAPRPGGANENVLHIGVHHVFHVFGYSKAKLWALLSKFCECVRNP